MTATGRGKELTVSYIPTEKGSQRRFRVTFETPSAAKLCASQLQSMGKYSEGLSGIV